MRTTVDIPDKLFRKVKATAALRGKRIKDLVEEGLLLALESPQLKKRGKEKPPTAYDLMKESIGIVDTGPLVALLDRRERHHAWAAEQVRDDHHVFTLDSNFTVYRKHGRKLLALIHPLRE